MKLTKKLIKEGLKNQVITILHMLAFNILSFFIFSIENIGMTPTGNTIGNGLFTLPEYKANLFFAYLSQILFLALFIIFYQFLKKDLKKQLKIHLSFVILFFIVTIIFCFNEFLIYLIASLELGLITTSNYTSYSYLYILIIIIILLYIIIDCIREKNKKNK